MPWKTPKDTDAVRVEFVRSMFLLAQDNEGKPEAFSAIKGFISSTAISPISEDEMERLDRYLKHLLTTHGLPGTDSERYIIEVATIARRAACGEALFEAAHQERDAG